MLPVLDLPPGRGVGKKNEMKKKKTHKFVCVVNSDREDAAWHHFAHMNNTIWNIVFEFLV